MFAHWCNVECCEDLFFFSCEGREKYHGNFKPSFFHNVAGTVTKLVFDDSTKHTKILLKFSF